jgi:molybdopterin molybdotransferase
VKLNPQGELDLFPNQGSGVLTSLSWADGVVDVPSGHVISPGDVVQFIPWQFN